MLAYVFWHWPRPGTEPGAYEAAQREFHAELGRAGSDGFLRSYSYRVQGSTWLPASRSYEDWYLLEGSYALDPLNEIAVSPRVRPAHDVAAGSATGAGGLYRLQSGVPEPHDGPVLWLAKPRGETYAAFYARFPGDAVLWRRQMVLGPAPEFCLESGRAPEGLDAVAAQREVLYS